MEKYFIEIGAGENGSLFTKELDENYVGFFVEPNYKSIEKLKKNRPGHHYLPYIVSDKNPQLFTSYLEESADMSAIPDTVPYDISFVYYNDEFILSEDKQVELRETVNLTTILSKDSYELMLIDVNGHEPEVLRSYDFYVPIKSILFNTHNCQEDRIEECRQILETNHYNMKEKLVIENQLFECWELKDKTKKCSIS